MREEVIRKDSKGQGQGIGQRRAMGKTMVRIAVLAALSFIPFQHALLAADRDEGMLVEYPDGSYGIDMGGGYQTLPGGRGGQTQELMLPPGYREDYRNTDYGAMTQDGLVIFPKFSFTPVADQRKKEEESKGEYIFHEASTTHYSPFLGVSGPKKEPKRPPGDLSR